MKKFVIPILIVVMGISIMFAGCAGGAEEPAPTATTPTTEAEAPEAEAPTSTPAPPKPGEWTASTGCSEFAFTFTVNPDSTGIAEIYYRLTEFECRGVSSSAESTVECIQIIPITGGQFTIESLNVARPFGERWDLTVQGRFDETGRYASGTWEISAEGTTCQAGTWESSQTP